LLNSGCYPICVIAGSLIRNKRKAESVDAMKLLPMFIVCVFSSAWCFASDIKPDLDTYNSKVKPLLNKYCFACHGPKKVKGKIRFDNMDPNIISGQHTNQWEDTLETFNLGEMPPEDEKQPTAEERDIIALWLDQEFKKARLAGNPNKKGNVRRLTRYEIKYSLQDLLNVPVSKEVENLPGESPSSETGLKNSSKLLMVSGNHIESYFHTVFAVFDKIRESLKHKQFNLQLDMANFKITAPKALYSEDNVNSKPKNDNKKKTNKKEPKKPQAAKKKKVKKEKGHYVKVEKKDGGIVIGAGGHASLLFPAIPKSLYRVSFEAKSDKPANVQLIMGFKYSATDRREMLHTLGTVSIPAGGKLVTKTIESYPDQLPYTISRSMDREYFIRIVNKSRTPIFVKSFGFAGNITDKVKLALIDPSVDKKDIKGVISSFASKALRRQLTEKEKDYYHGIFQGFAKTQSNLAALISTYEELLCLPEFFYMGIPAEMEQKKNKNFAIAEKLSYFLWCSIPDEALIKDAAAGKLTDKKVLEYHVDRMLKDPRAHRLVENFTDQWLHTSTLFNVAVDTLYYKGFKDSIKTLMHKETYASIDAVLRKNSPAINLLKADHVYVNDELARYYGIKGVVGSHFRKVPVTAKSHRGGLLTQGTFLIGNSDGMNSHAILRGVWLTEVILNDPPPEPPKNVPPFDETIPGFNKMTLNQKLFHHRNSDACRNCHNKIDPWGLLFENFDASGKWREKVLMVSSEKVKGKKKPVVKKEYQPVESEATLYTKEKLKGIDELKDYLVKKRSVGFAEGFTEKLLSYALSRDVDFYDQDLVDKLNSKFMATNYSANTLIKSIVTSEEFLKGAVK